MKIMAKSGVKKASDYLTNLKMENVSKPIAFICCSFADLIITVSDKIKTYLPHSGFVIGIKRGIRDTFFIKFKKIKKPFLIEGVGYGPLKTQLSKYLARKIISTCDEISLRTKEDFKKVVKFRKDSIETYDPAFDYFSFSR